MDKLSRKQTKWVTQPVDDWLKDEGYFRKALPRDPTCLFRSVSEQIYNTQFYHVRVRKECVEFMRDNVHFFKENISDPLDKYLEQLSCITQSAGMNEIEAISRLYKREVMIFHAHSMTKTKTTNGYDKFINLCHTAPEHYEAVYKYTMIAPTAFCQSVVYQILYKNVFQMSSVDETVNKMLHDKTPPVNARQNRFNLNNNIAIRGQSESFNKIDNYAKRRTYDSVTKVANPFPYRVAKALDPNVYRNIDFDIWHELKWEARGAAWSRWNNSHLQVGGKCRVQLNMINHNFDQTNNNFQTIVRAHNTNDKSTSQHQLVKSPGQVSAGSFVTGHIQEMTKNQGPVVVFIEELGERKTVPYGALKPLQEDKKLNSQFNNMSIDSEDPKWKSRWNGFGRRTKESVAGVPSGLDRINNNKNESTSTRKDNSNSTSSDSANTKNSASVSNKYTNPDKMSANGKSTAAKTVETRSASVSVDKSEKTAAQQESKAIVCKYPVPSSSDSNLTSRDKQLRNRDNNFPLNKTPSVSTQPAAPHEPFYPPHSGIGGIPMYPGNLNVVCVSPDGNVFAPLPYVGGNMQSAMPPNSNGLERNQIVNLAVSMSVEANGADLPYSDVATLRYFYNLGVECYRQSHGWGANGLPPMTYPPPFIPAPNLMPPMPMSATPSPTSTSTESSPPQQNLMRPNFPQNRRRPDINPNLGRVFMPHPSPRNNYPRRDSQEAPKGRNDIPNIPHEFPRARNFNGNDKSKEFNQGTWDARRNGQNGRYNKRNNDGRRDGRPGQFHYDAQKSNNGIPIIHKSSNFNNDNHNQKTHKADGHFQSPVVHVNQVPRTTSGPVTSHQAPYNHQQPAIYTNVPFYGSEAEVFYPPNTNMYSVPYLPHPEANDGSNAAVPYAGPPAQAENYPQTVSPLFTPVPYTLHPVYPVPAQNNPENWYSVAGQPQFVPYTAGTVTSTVTQPPTPTMSIAPTTSSC